MSLGAHHDEHHTYTDRPERPLPSAHESVKLDKGRPRRSAGLCTGRFHAAEGRTQLLSPSRDTSVG